MPPRTKTVVFTILAIVLIPCSLLAYNHLYTATKGNAGIHDADTLSINHQVIDLFGIDAPELDQMCVDEDYNEYPCGRTARQVLIARINNREITCKGNYTSNENKAAKICSLRSLPDINVKDYQDTSLNYWLVLNGHAVADTLTTDKYATAEATARRLLRGIHRGHFQLPWTWREEDSLH